MIPAGLVPGLPQLGSMQRRPFKDQGQCAAAHLAFDNLQRIDVHLNLLALVNRMKVRRRMVAIEHADNDPVEATEFRHGGSVYVTA